MGIPRYRISFSMNASVYKQQFLAFLKTAYPNGLPAEFDVMMFDVGGVQFPFRFDVEDYLEVLVTPELPQKRARKPQFDKSLNAQDVKFLKALRIKVDNGKKSKR